MTASNDSADEEPELTPDAAFDGGDLDCGNGLLLKIRQHIDPLPRGGLLEIHSRERSVLEDLPAWCRMTLNELVRVTPTALGTSFLVCKGPWIGGKPGVRDPNATPTLAPQSTQTPKTPPAPTSPTFSPLRPKPAGDRLGLLPAGDRLGPGPDGDGQRTAHMPTPVAAGAPVGGAVGDRQATTGDSPRSDPGADEPSRGPAMVSRESIGSVGKPVGTAGEPAGDSQARSPEVPPLANSRLGDRLRVAPTGLAGPEPNPEPDGDRQRVTAGRGTAGGGSQEECCPILAGEVSLPLLPVMGIGSWPRPTWLRRALTESLEGRMSEAEFQATADDAVRLVIDSQLRAGVQVITDGEQRRDNYASFVGGLLDNCQLIPLTDLLPYVDDPAKFAAELQALDVPATEVRHPAVLGRLGRSRPLALHEFQFARYQTQLPVKVALPGPYLLTRTMWLECVTDRAYDSRGALSADIIRVLRAELFDLLQAGVSMIQFDEPVLTEVALGRPTTRRSFMCGALSERLPPDAELAFALELFEELMSGMPLERVALHVCRGNWTPDETKALSGSYEPLMDFLCRVPVGNYFLEACTPRAGDWKFLTALPVGRRVGLGMVNQKQTRIEPDDEIIRRAELALRLFGDQRLMMTPDCGFATFADNPLSSSQVATDKLAALSRVRRQLLGSEAT